MTTVSKQQEAAIQKASGAKVSFFIPSTDDLGHLNNMKADFSLTLKYKTAEDWAVLKDKPIKCFFMGLKEIPNDKGELVMCGVFVSRQECFIAGGMTLVEAVRRLEVKTPVQITYEGKKPNKSSDGSTMMFDVQTLA